MNSAKERGLRSWMIFRNAEVALAGQLGLSSERDMAGSYNSWKSKRKKNRFYKRKGFWIGFFLFFSILGIVGWRMFDHYTKPYQERALTYDLERINDIEVPSLIIDRNGKEIGRIFVENRSMMAFEDVPQNFINALKAGEDSRFDTHDGIDYIGVGRAAKKLISEKGKVTQGASTITQQLARDAYSLKAEAIKRGGNITVIKTDLSSDCPQATSATEWGCGWRVYFPPTGP